MYSEIDIYPLPTKGSKEASKYAYYVQCTLVIQCGAQPTPIVSCGQSHKHNSTLATQFYVHAQCFGCLDYKRSHTTTSCLTRGATWTILSFILNAPHHCFLCVYQGTFMDCGFSYSSYCNI